jgi:dTDP-4-dehydrorhamnose reductase
LRILLTGINGQVGAALSSRLGAFGTVVPVDRAALDLARPGAIAGRLSELSPDLIVNPAAYTAVDRAEDEPDVAFMVNAEAPRAMARWAAERAVPLIHFSTDYVFDGSGAVPWRETDSTGPLSVYGASKLAGETAIRDAGGLHLMIRTSWVYSPHGSNFLRTIVRLAKEREELRIVGDQIGAPTSAGIIADCVVALCGRPEGIKAVCARADGLIHLTASGATSWHGFASAIVEGLQTRGIPMMAKRIVPIATTDFPTKAQRPLNSRLDLTRLQSLGIVPPEWRDGLKPALDSIAASRN